MVSLNISPELFTRLAIMLSLTVVFGGLGSLFNISFLKYSISVQTVEHLGMALAIGLAIVTLLVSGLSFLGVPLTKTILSIALLSGCGLSLLRLIKNPSNVRNELHQSWNRNSVEINLPILLFFLLLVWRVIQIRDVFVPNWYSGLIHTSLLQEFANKNAIPFDTIYPVGFHAVALMVHLVWGLSFPESILLFGQWLSVVCGVSFYIFIRRYVRNPYASLLGFVVFSFILLFPSSLISWGHYPYLLGFALLLPAILTSQDWIDNRKNSFWITLILAISMGQTHYGSFVLWFAFVLVYSLTKIFSSMNLKSDTLGSRKKAIFRSVFLIFFALIFIFSKTVQPAPQNIVQNNMLSQSFDPDPRFSTWYILRLFFAHDYLFFFVWILVIIWTLVWKRKLTTIILFWPMANLFLIWAQYQVLENPISIYANLIIFLSIQLSLSLGLFAQQFLLWLIKLNSSDVQPQFKHQLKSRLSIILAIVIIVSVSSSPLSIDQNTVLFTNEDMLAMKWIIENTVQDSGFMIRNIRWRNNILIPSDGGGWITILTGRRTIIPQTGELYDICDYAMEHGVDYLYFGRQRGNSSFDLRLSDINVNDYDIVYGTQSVEIALLRCQ